MNRQQTAIEAFERGEIREALRLFTELLQEQETSELWNDWATAQSVCGDSAKAESGFLRALELDSGNSRAKMNLGLLLGRSQYGRAIPLIEESLPLLAEEEAALLRAALTGARERMQAEHSQPMRILLIDDAIPPAGKNSMQARTIQLTRALRKLGHDVILIVRDDGNRAQWETEMSDLGVQFLAGDVERLNSLGRDLASAAWSFAHVLESNRFAAAILTQNFKRGLSIPEHYLDEIRRLSPATRIAIFSDELHGPAAACRFAATQEFRHHEFAENVRHREDETFLRADLVIVPDDKTTAELHREYPDLKTEIAVLSTRPVPMRKQLAELLHRTRSLVPKPPANAPFSVNLVEAIYSSLLQTVSGEKRVYSRLDFYIQFAEQLLRQDKSHLAREQLRHIFGWLGDSLQPAPALAQPLGLLKRCYRALGDQAMAERCADEARSCFTAGTTRRAEGSSAQAAAYQLSLIVPTYNRLSILKKCMAALENQSVAPDKFEVIVIDDGSSDGTEDFMRSYQPPFQLQYLRQSNSGTGAARQNGVRHAVGEYLLLMNDDTICDPNVLGEHLRAQQMYSGYRWAVLGDFEYPAEARQRALTHFFRVNSFMFPQVDMAEGCPYGYSHFITCNLSIRRDAIVEAGSFDSTYKLSEDTEIGIRLFEMGYGVVYHPAAHAWHDHLPYAVENLIRRARVYGADYFHMFRNHPRVMREWAMPISLQGVNERDADCIRGYLGRNRGDVQAAVAALQRWDSVDFEPVLAKPAEARHVLSLFQQAVPAIHWFHLYESMLETMAKELHLSRPEFAPPMALGAAQGS